jgi:hypothetical protein
LEQFVGSGSLKPSSHWGAPHDSAPPVARLGLEYRGEPLGIVLYPAPVILVRKLLACLIIIRSAFHFRLDKIDLLFRGQRSLRGLRQARSRD